MIRLSPDDPDGVPDDPGVRGPDDPDGVPDDPALVEAFGCLRRTYPDNPGEGLDVPDSGPDVRPSSSSRSIFLSFLPSSLPCFTRRRCSRSLALALLLDICEAPTIPMHAYGRSVK